MHPYSSFEEGDISIKIFLRKTKKDLVIKYYKKSKLIKKEFFSFDKGVVFSYEGSFYESLNEKVELSLKELKNGMV